MDIIEKIKNRALDLSVPIIRDGGAEILTALLRERRCAKILEIGTGVGYSGALMLSAAKNASLVTVEIDGVFAELARSFFREAGLEKRVRLIEGDATEAVLLMDGGFDFILLDGPKGQYERLRPYLVGLLNPGGIIFADNALFKGYVEDFYIRRKHRSIVKSLKAFIENMRNDARFRTTLSDAGDGILIAEYIKTE
ncbi:MAG: O-methyltransferase [Clostridiales bacterium]|jgi:caffeoyl-CoA O-methyltransferase|nr:O-methyltransferase [Clostridiales bacterium]